MTFFVTARGKGARDGIGGCIKRHYCIESLQETTAEKVFEWDHGFLNKIKFLK